MSLPFASITRFAEAMSTWDTEKDKWLAEALEHRPDANPRIVATMTAGEQARFILDWIRFGSDAPDIPVYVLLAIMDGEWIAA